VSVVVISFDADDDDLDVGAVVDPVGVAARRGFPVTAPGGGHLLLHDTTVGRVDTTAAASAVLRTVAGAELLLFVFPGEERCAASTIEGASGRVIVRVDFGEAPRAECERALRSLETLLDALPAVAIEVTLDGA
jgi:hypothetical protein